MLVSGPEPLAANWDVAIPHFHESHTASAALLKWVWDQGVQFRRQFIEWLTDDWEDSHELPGESVTYVGLNDDGTHGEHRISRKWGDLTIEEKMVFAMMATPAEISLAADMAYYNTPRLQGAE